MNSLTKFVCGVALVASAPLFAISNSAVSNAGPSAGPALAPTLDAGWGYDQINAAFQNSINSPATFNLTGCGALFSITDDFVPGDTFFVYDFGNLILTTTISGGGQTFGGGVGGAAYSWGSVALSAGVHVITIQGDGVGGVPAGLYTRLDAIPCVPDAGSTALLGGAALVGLVGLRRKLA